MPIPQSQLTRVNLPYTTETPGLRYDDFDNLWRVRELETQVSWLNKEDGTLYRLLEMMGKGPSLSQMIYYWLEENWLDMHTKINLAAGYTAAATTFVVDDARVFVVNTLIVCPRTLEAMLCTAVDYSANTVTVTRGYGNTAAAALVDDDVLLPTGAQLAELADPNGGTGIAPGTQTYNYVSRISETVKISHVQEGAAMIDGWGLLPNEIARKTMSIKRQINKALIFNPRAVETTADGPLWMSGGFLSFLQGNVLDLRDNNGLLTEVILNDYMYDLFYAKGSSATKTVVCGPSLFSAFSRIQRDMGVGEAPYYNPTWGTTTLKVMHEEGGTLDIMLDKWGFAPQEGLGGMGLVMDMPFIQMREYNNEPLTWRPNIQEPRSHVREDEIFGSFSLQVKQPSLHGLIMGAKGRVEIPGL